MTTVLDERTREWLQWLVTTSHPIRHFDPDDVPDGFGSATLLDYRNRRFLVTAGHNIPKSATGWFLELEYEPRTGTSVFWPERFYYLADFTKSTGSVRDVDCCFCELPKDLNSVYQFKTPWVSGEKVDRHVFLTDLLTEPDPTEVFAFAGDVKPELHGPGVIATELNVYPGLRFVNADRELLTFKLPVAHPGHAQFRGCSGAPIADRQRRVVGILCGGNEADSTVHGVSIMRVKPALDAYCDQNSDA